LVGDRLGIPDPWYGCRRARHQTPLSIAKRRFSSHTPEPAPVLFGSARLPTLVQYDPTNRSAEVQDGTRLFSGDSGIPLIRDHIADHGSLVPFNAIFDPGHRIACGRLPWSARRATNDLPMAPAGDAVGADDKIA